MGTLDGGNIFGKALHNEGVKAAFVLCGGHIMPIFYGMRQANIEIIDMRHECAAVYAAIAYMRASGNLAVVVTTAGPGVANTPAGMIEAQSLGVPVLQIGGAVAMDHRDTGALQDMSTLTLMRSCSKWARKVTNAARIPEYVSMALRNAMDGAPGPVYLEVPTNILFDDLEEEEVFFPKKEQARALPFGDPNLVDRAAGWLAEAQKPAVLVDDGAHLSMGDYAPTLAQLCDRLKMPLGIAGRACRGMFGDEEKQPLLNKNVVHNADVVLAMGCRFDFRLMSGKLIPPKAKVIQVHTDPRQIGYNLRADMGIVGGTGPVAHQILESLDKMGVKRENPSWAEDVSKIGQSYFSKAFAAEGAPIHPARCAAEVAKFVETEGRDWSVVCDGGEASVWIGGAVKAHRPGQLHGSGANGTIGTGPGLVIGAWTANRRPVLWYTGDGSFGFYAMEMDTMARLGIPVVCVISNDSAWGMIRLAEKYIRPDEIEVNGHCHCDLAPMRAYEKMVHMWNGHGEVVKDAQEIIPAIRRAVQNGTPSIINVEVDQVSISPYIAAYAQTVKPG